MFTRPNLHQPKPREHCFGGASKTSGLLNGIRTKLKEACLDALFVHGDNHAVNLVLQEARNMKLITDTLNSV